MKTIIANWKSNKNISEAREWVKQFTEQMKVVSNSGQLRVVITPAFPLLLELHQQLHDLSPLVSIELGVQDLSSYPAGSYTGAVSGVNLDELNVKYAILGHSERRKYFHETNQDVANKVAQAVDNQITPVVCIDQEYLASQASAIEPNYLDKLMVAYEPLSAIGSGQNMDVETVNQVKARVAKFFGNQAQFIYGGSVDQSNVADYLAVTDGVLVGGASLEVDKFVALLRSASNS